MKIKLTQVIMNLCGEPFKTGGITCPKCGNVSGEAEDMTLRFAVLQALTALDKSDGKEKFLRYKLALTVADADEPDLTHEDIVKIKKLIGSGFAPMIVGRCYEMLEG